MNSSLVIKHSWLLLKRNYKFSFLQMLPSFLLTLMFSFFYKTYLFDTETISPFYYKILFLYLILTLLISFFVSIVIFYKETKIEIKTLNYLYWTGYSKVKLNLIVITKWSIIILIGIIISSLFFVFYQYLFGEISSNINIIKIFMFSIPINILLLPGVIIALILNNPLNEFK